MDFIFGAPFPAPLLYPGSLADFLGFHADAGMLRSRRGELAGLISKHMWLPSLGIFSNVLLNGTAYPRISPTSFYPMLAGLAS